MADEYQAIPVAEIDLTDFGHQRQFDRGIKMERHQIAYYYSGVVKPEEADLNEDGLSRIPSGGEILVRPGGKQWKVVEVVARHRGINAPPCTWSI
jgi:hypothetical protein